MFKFVIARLSSTNSFYLLIITGVLMSIFEAISIFSLGPFITMVLSPEVIGENEYILFIKDYLSIEESKDFITFFGVITLISIIFGNVNNIFHQYFVHKCSYFFGRDLAFEYINTFLSSNSIINEDFQNEEVIKNATVESTRTVEWVVQPVVGSVFRALSLLIIFLALIIYSWQISLALGLAIFFLYFLIFQGLKGWLEAVGQKTSDSLSEKQVAVSEIIHGKDIINSNNKKEFFLDRFFKTSSIESMLKSKSTLASYTPRAILEGIAFGSITCIMLAINIFSSESVSPNFLTSLGIFTVAAYKILPSAQMVYFGISRAQYNLSSLRSFYSSLKIMKKNMNKHKDYVEYIQDDLEYPYLELQKLSYEINGEHNKKILDEINIKNNDLPIIGLIGPSGGGKTSILRLIAGSEEPTKGKILFSEDVTNLSYVSQSVITFRGSLIDNITLFDPSPNIEYLRLIWDMCEISFCKIEDAKDLLISDDGLNISGGQNQRINLARALYSKPRILLLDEFTSALDNEIESSILQKLKTFCKKEKIKVVMSAHRDSARESCDIFYYVDKGKCSEKSDILTPKR